jgi:SAM-dependent methyltransferase
MSDYFTRHLESMAPHRAILRAVECKLMGSVPLVAPVLDIGCGDGHFASIAYATPIDVGVDVREAEAREAAARGRSVYRSVTVASATALPFADGTFATVMSNCAIEHIPDNRAVLAEIGRVLRSGGTFATTLPSIHFAEYLLGATVMRRARLVRLADRYGRFFNRISKHHHIYDESEWRRRLEDVGLAVVDHQYYFSARAHRAFDASHYLGVPNLISRKISGKWVVHPVQMKPFDRWLRPYYDEPLPQPTGAYQFVRCVKT